MRTRRLDCAFVVRRQQSGFLATRAMLGYISELCIGKQTKYAATKSNGPIDAGDARIECSHRIVCFVCFVAFRPKSTAMVMAGRSVHITAPFPGQA